MRQLFVLIIFLLLYVQLFAQQKKNNKKSGWDTTFISVKLHDTIEDNKIIVYDIGKKATIYLKEKLIIKKASEYLLNDFTKESYSKIIKYLDSCLLENDTIYIKAFDKNLMHFDYLVSKQLIEGSAKVFYKKANLFVDTIFQRLERFGGHGDRFFYLPDKRAFFSATEMIGLMDDDALFSGKYFQDYLKEGEKLARLQDE